MAACLHGFPGEGPRPQTCSGRNLALRGLRGILRARSPSQSSAKVCPISEDSAETVDIIAYEDTLGCCERELQNHLGWFSRVSDMYVGCPIDSIDVHGHGAVSELWAGTGQESANHPLLLSAPSF